MSTASYIKVLTYNNIQLHALCGVCVRACGSACVLCGGVDSSRARSSLADSDYIISMVTSDVVQYVQLYLQELYPSRTPPPGTWSAGPPAPSTDTLLTVFFSVDFRINQLCRLVQHRFDLSEGVVT